MKHELYWDEGSAMTDGSDGGIWIFVSSFRRFFFLFLSFSFLFSFFLFGFSFRSHVLVSYSEWC